MRNPWDSFAANFYKLLPKEILFYSQITSNWMDRQASKFLLDNILGSNGNPDCIVGLMDHWNLPIVELPASYRYHIPTNEGDINSKHFVKLFFENLVELCDDDITESRKKVLKILLEISAEPRDQTQSEMAPLLKHHFASLECIPCEPDGTLRKCIDLIYPGAPFAPLFDESDKRFPINLLVSSMLAIKGLQNGGMQHDVLTWNLVRDRAESVLSLYKQNVESALKRAELLISTLARHVLGSPPSEIKLSSIPFLPVLCKPSDYALEWAGDYKEVLLDGQTVVMEVNSMSTKNSLLAGSQVGIVNNSNPVSGGCGEIPNEVQQLLCLRSEPTVTEVISHLKVIYLTSSDVNPVWINQSCSIVYDFLNHALASSVTEIEEICGMKSFPCLWNGSKFISTEDVAKIWRHPQGPYLHSIPEVVAGKANLITALSIKHEFNTDDALTALEKMKNQFQENPIDKNCEVLLEDIFTILKSVQDTQNWVSKVVYLPSENLILHQSKDLAYNDAGWAPKDEDYHYVHNNIPRHMAVLLGVRLVRSKMLDQFVSKDVHFPGVEFGQREQLTRRIQNIIRDYPFDITLLKELLQNADDAKAKKLHIILDKRTHGKKSLISENWQKLQGPSLLVWNDSIFSDDNLKGIQEVGLGSKRSESETIGQYGIGFNVVYHLTDCPSFITGGETLCIMDPHCKYAEGATPLSPGRMYTNLTKGFWGRFEDMSSTYLVNGVDNLPEPIQHGSLFRFPLRHSKELVQSSNILDHTCGVVQPMTADRLEKDLKQWFPDMKGAMLFLQHVSEIKFIVIEENTRKLNTVHHYSRCIPDEEEFSTSITKFECSVSNFNPSSRPISDRVLYPLRITEHTDKSKKNTEEWLIQEGIGDLNNEGVNWKYSSGLKPQHGIAAPLNVSSSTRDKKKQLYCFLPLPTSIDLPVHINGSFILDSNRRDIWSPSDPNKVDDKSRWNQSLFMAVASSYVEFLKHCKSYYVDETFSTWKTAIQNIQKFSEVFPHDTVTKPKKFNELIVKEVYNILIKVNPNILCIILSKEKTNLSHLAIEWQPLNSINREDQVYFWGTIEDRKVIHPILESIGMKITYLPNYLQRKLNSFLTNDRKQLPSITPASVFEYYSACSIYSELKVMTIKPISSTVFENPDKLLVFLKFLLCVPLCEANESAIRTFVYHFNAATTVEKYEGMFPNCPFSHFLLLTADGNLRAFDRNAKVISSEFFNVFADHQDKFLHPSLLELQMNKSYFICDFEEEENKQYAVDLITQILVSALPDEMSTSSVIEEASTIISKNDLLKYWDIFKKDRVLRSYLPIIVKKIALLPTLDDRLFSLSSEILPMYLPHSTDNLPVVEKAIEVFHKLKLPFLDSSVVTIQVDCPDITANADMVLRNLVLFNNEKCLTSVIINEEVNVLIDYFSDYLDVKNHLQDVCSLPLFEDVTGKYQAIHSFPAYVWPNSCSNGYNSWIAGYSAIFLKNNGHWTQLGPLKKLSVLTISEAGLYNQFIFCHPHFGQMVDKDRYAHLKYIRDNLFFKIQIYRKAKIKKDTEENLRLVINEAANFYRSLVSLNCIGATDTILLPISTFCDHTQDIFCTFPDDFKILPKELRGMEWLDFFIQINLKEILSTKEYIDICHKTANGKVSNVKTASEVLLKYLGDKEKSFDSQSLHSISNIPFVFAEPCAQVEWLHAGMAQATQLVKMNGSALLDLQPLIWTVRPLIRLPECFSKELMKKLGVVYMPSESDICSNIKNISKTNYSKDELFTIYPASMKPPQQALTLLQIMLKIFDNIHTFDFSKISSLPCIPVHTDLNCTDGSQIALVKPNCVIISKNQSDVFHPYLYHLPQEFDMLHGILEKIGVSRDITLKHMQIVLEKAFLKSENRTIQINTKKKVKEVIYNVVGLLLSCLEENLEKNADQLKPLYLPDVTGVLRLSTSLIYVDVYTTRRDCLKLNLEGTQYHQFDINGKTYGTSARTFCNLLPSAVRPLALSLYCDETPNSCEEVPHCELASILQQTFNDSSNADHIANAITEIIAEEKNKLSFAQGIKKFFKATKMSTVRKLTTAFVLKDSKKVICERQTHFAMHNKHLYFDSQASSQDSWIAKRIAKSILPSVFSKYSCHENKKELVKFVADFIIASLQRKMEMLDEHQIMVAREDYYGFTDLSQLGAEIPGLLHDRLLQHFDNIYNPLEIVGYEIEEGRIIIAQIVYLIQPVTNCSVCEKRYKIYIDDEDEEGHEVSILQLFKFIDGESMPELTCATAADESTSIVPHDSDSSLTNLRASLNQKSTTDKKRFICEQLRDLWSLDPDLKRKGIKRLYLMYHPDKNPDNEEECGELFQYLKEEIEHFERNGPIDDPSTYSAANSTMSSGTNSTSFDWTRDFNDWDATAHYHKQRKDYNSRQNHQSGPSHPFAKSERVNDKNPSEGRRWIRQAQTDMCVLESCLTQAHSTNGYAHVCFLAHEVAEKALKGGMYTLCGLDYRKMESHQLLNNAHALCSLRPHLARNLPSLCCHLEAYYLKTRYPNQWPGHTDAPFEHYNLEDAEAAKNYAREILEIVISIVPDMHN